MEENTSSNYDLKMQESDMALEIYARLRLDFVKITLEYFGHDFGETKNNINYMNYMAGNPITFGSPGGFETTEFGTLGNSIINYAGVPPKGADAVMRGVYIAKRIAPMLGLNLMQACAISGYCMKESSCNPTSGNKTEAAGKGSPYANGANCGEGIAQWTNVAYKDKQLAVIGLPPGGHPGRITALSMDQQIEMYARGSLGRACRQYNLHLCRTLDAAVCVACLQGHGPLFAQRAWQAANGDVNSPAYIQASFAQFSAGRQDLPRARAWAEQVFRSC